MTPRHPMPVPAWRWAALLGFALLAPADAGSEHLRALARVSRLMRQPDLRAQLRQARSAEMVLSLLEREAQPSAA
jgi:PTS system nitrogen regulatory IIA component